jgi:trimeric autotransporter adhesin
MEDFLTYTNFMKRNNYNFILLLFVAVLGTTSLRAQYISRFAGNGFGSGTAVGGFSGDGALAVDARMNGCTGVAVDGAGNVYIADKGNNVVRKVSTAGIITTFAGTGTEGYSGNGGLAILAKLNAPSAVATDGAGNVYIADNGNSTVRVVNTLGIIRNYAGSGTAGYAGNGDTATHGMLNDPQGMAIDASGNMYIADAGNHVIRKVAAGTHIMTTFAGTGTLGYTGNGGAATAARLFNPTGVAMDASGNLYIADFFNNAVRKVSVSGTISAFAGTGAAGNSGDGSAAAAATMSLPASVSVDMSGNVYIADQGNNNIRMVNAAGTITHVAGASINGFSGDGGFATTARLGSPKCVYADGWGHVYIADYNNHVVRRISSTAGVNDLSNDEVISVYPNPSTGNFTVSLPASVRDAIVTVTDMTGRIAVTQKVSGSNGGLNLTALVPGNYLIHVTTGENEFTSMIAIEK